MTATTTPILNKYQQEMLADALVRVETLKAQRASLADEITGRMEALAATFGTDAVEYVNEEGRTVRFRLVTSKRTSYKAVVDEVKATATKPLAQFIDRSIEDNTTEATRKVLTASKPKGKRGASPKLDSVTVKGIRQSLRHNTQAEVAKKYGVSQPTIGRIARRQGAYAKG